MDVYMSGCELLGESVDDVMLAHEGASFWGG